MIRHKIAEVDGLHVFYREAGDPANPKLVLLHGFPASSHQYRNLMPALEDRFYLIAPDYPGWQHRHARPAAFDYTFDRLSEITEGLLLWKASTASDCTYKTTAALAGIRRPPPRVAGVADRPELQRLRGGLHRGVGCLPPRAVAKQGPWRPRHSWSPFWSATA